MAEKPKALAPPSDKLPIYNPKAADEAGPAISGAYTEGPGPWGMMPPSGYEPEFAQTEQAEPEVAATDDERGWARLLEYITRRNSG
jgi:hypothetical protein